MDPARQKRKTDISEALTFIQSSLAYPDPEGYQDFLTQLVCNLLEEGNACFRDRQWQQAIREFSEGLNVSNYAEADDIQISEALLESLYVNRAAAYHSMGEFDQGVQDCDKALEVCKDSRRALYRKALCLKELGEYKEAYNCTTKYLLSTPQDKQVKDLAQELTNHLGLRIRKPYVSAKVPVSRISNGTKSPLSSVVPVDFSRNCQTSFTSTPPSDLQPTSSVAPDVVEALEDTELMDDDLDTLLDCFPTEPAETHIQAAFPVPGKTSATTSSLPPVLPAPTPQLPPAFFSSAISPLNSLDSFLTAGHSTSAATLDILDDLSGTGGGAGASNSALPSAALDSLDDLDSLDGFSDVALSSAAAAAAAAEEVDESQIELDSGEKSLDELLDELNPLEGICYEGGPQVPKGSINTMDQLDSLDALDSFPSVKGGGAALPVVSFGGMGLDSLSDFSPTGSNCAAAPVTRALKNHYKEKSNQRRVSIYNPLSATHEFLQACSLCFPREGKGVDSFVHKPDLIHDCKRDILLCRRKAACPPAWTRVRPLPTKSSFTGPFLLCKNLLDSGFCKYEEKCTFAYNQLEIDVWTQERKGTLDRRLMFETEPVKLDPVNSIIRLLQEHKGSFIFLCQECYDNKPRVISKRSRANPTTCSNTDVHHNFDANKCLAFVVSTFNVNYSKVRPLSVLCLLDLCRKAIRYGCQWEDECNYAHSIIELKTWRVQRDTGISPDEIVKISTKHLETEEQNSSKQKGNRLSSGGDWSKPKGAEGGRRGGGKTLNMNMKFACAQCWRDGLISEPDKTLKYCSAKARHMWTKERRVLLVKSPERSKWVQVRPLPHAKNFPLYYDMCAQIRDKKKCNYSGNCTFAHSEEEREMWMYMKNHDLREMQQMYDMWLTLTGHKRQTNGAVSSQPVPEEKGIVMPTDYAEPMTGFHCRLCGKHSNSERQWQQHISSEKHKDRVFSCEGEDEALTWSYRFPGARFELCPRLSDGSADGCPERMSCDYAHSPEELQEWRERRDFLRRKLARARDDMLIMPEQSDFGKYNFLLQD
ncbi:zinc finger CCCH domain-containing protein 7B-like [Mugil cephalus]|uniref:zinc finger CCCH domain-containing protein 7B-like n=1 Tax=Mugil cephalus TaxID=48193 RepID=UPI001FB85B75|nr:zinc finger CCCH domain-containing protein 7B-like [Mugil cephalus]